MQGFYDLGPIHTIGVSVTQFTCKDESYLSTIGHNIYCCGTVTNMKTCFKSTLIKLTVFKSNSIPSTHHYPLLQRTTQYAHPEPQRWCGSCHRPPARHHWYPSLVWACSDFGCHFDLDTGHQRLLLCYQRNDITLKWLRQDRAIWEISCVPSLPKSPSPHV